MESSTGGKQFIEKRNQPEPLSVIRILTDEEIVLSGQVQKNQSIEASLICAYNYANKNDNNIKIFQDLIGSFGLYLFNADAICTA